MSSYACPKEPPPEIRITHDGDYYAKIKDTWYEAELSYLGTPIIGKRLPSAPANLDTSPPAQWGSWKCARFLFIEWGTH